MRQEGRSGSLILRRAHAPVILWPTQLLVRLSVPTTTGTGMWCPLARSLTPLRAIHFKWAVGEAAKAEGNREDWKETFLSLPVSALVAAKSPDFGKKLADFCYVYWTLATCCIREFGAQKFIWSGNLCKCSQFAQSARRVCLSQVGFDQSVVFALPIRPEYAETISLPILQSRINGDMEASRLIPLHCDFYPHCLQYGRMGSASIPALPALVSIHC